MKNKYTVTLTVTMTDGEDREEIKNIIKEALSEYKIETDKISVKKMKKKEKLCNRKNCPYYTLELERCNGCEHNKIPNQNKREIAK